MMLLSYIAPSGLCGEGAFFVGFYPTLIYIAPSGLAFNKEFVYHYPKTKDCPTYTEQPFAIKTTTIFFIREFNTLSQIGINRWWLVSENKYFQILNKYFFK